MLIRERGSYKTRMKVISVLGDSTSGLLYIRRGCCRKEKLVEEERKVRHMKLKDAIA